MHCPVYEKRGGITLKTLLIIPAYNEELNIERVVTELVEDYPEYDYVVVNDGSSDSTAQICRMHGYRLIDLPVNLGLAGAFQAGMRYAWQAGYDCAVQFDADGQHLPQYVAPLIEGIESSNIAIGSRFVTEKKPHSMRMFGSDLLSIMIRLTTGKKIHDPTSGMRAYDRHAISLMSHGPNMGPEPDTLAFLMRKRGIEVTEVQVHMAERVAGESYLNPAKSAAYMVRMALSVLFVQFFR